MQLNGTVHKSLKTGVFKPEDDPTAAYPYGFILIKDSDDPNGGYVKVKPSEDELEEFTEHFSGAKKGDAVSVNVALDRFGNLRAILE